MAALTCSMHVNQCTLKKALDWEMCLSHLEQARIQVLWRDRLIHIILFVATVLPIIGQIVALFELCMLRLFSFPQPISSIPPRHLIRYQNQGEADRYWPTDLTLLGINEEQRAMLDGHIREAARTEAPQWGKKTLRYAYGGARTEAHLPCSLAMVKVNGTFQAILFPKTVFVEARRKIRWAYNVMTGEYLLKKRVVGQFEEGIIKHMRVAREARGVVYNSGELRRESFDKQGKLKRQFIEPVRDGIVSILYGTQPFTEFNVKRGVIFDLLHELRDLHHIRLEEELVPIKQTESNVERAVIFPRHFAFHSDIKFSNCLGFSQDRWRAELCDFEEAGNLMAGGLSVGFTSPEYIRFYRDRINLAINNDELIAFNCQYGQARDMWSLGLVILSTLVGRLGKVSRGIGRPPIAVAPLPCLEASIRMRRNLAYEEEGILSLQQQVLDRDIDQLQIEVLKRHPEAQPAVRLFFQGFKQMLRVNPHERVTIDQLLAFLAPINA